MANPWLSVLLSICGDKWGYLSPVYKILLTVIVFELCQITVCAIASTWCRNNVVDVDFLFLIHGGQRATYLVHQFRHFSALILIRVDLLLVAPNF